MADTKPMTNLFYRLKNLPFYLFAPFFFCAFVLIIINLLSLFPADSFDALYSGISQAITSLFSFCSAAFITHFTCKNSKKAFAAGFCILLFDAVLFSLCSVHISFVFGIVFSLFFAAVYKKNALYQGFYLCALISLVAALAAGLLYDYFYSLLKLICFSLKGRGALFGAVNNLYSLLFSNNLSELFLHKDYSGTAFSGGRIVSGVIDIFEAQGFAGINASRYLSGKYFVNIFVCTPIFLLLYSRFERNGKNAFLLCFILGAVFGDIRLFSLFLLIYNPLMYLGFLLMIIISYFSAYLLDIQMVYLKEGSIFEMMKYIDKPVYFLAAGFVLAVLCYFFQRIILSKFDFQSRRILPYEVKKLVNALGGEDNIQKVDEERVELRNSNLIDILKLDCDIRGNSAFLNHDDLSLLKKFY